MWHLGATENAKAVDHKGYLKVEEHTLDVRGDGELMLVEAHYDV